MTSDKYSTISKLGPLDVLCGRDKICFANVGNHQFRVRINENVNRYLSCETKSERSKMIGTITKEMLNSSKGSIRFFKRVQVDDSSDDALIEQLTEKQSRDKVAHALRDCASQHRNSRRHHPDRKIKISNDAVNSSISIESGVTRTSSVPSFRSVPTQVEIQPENERHGISAIERYTSRSSPSFSMIDSSTRYGIENTSNSTFVLNDNMNFGSSRLRQLIQEAEALTKQINEMEQLNKLQTGPPIEDPFANTFNEEINHNNGLNNIAPSLLSHKRLSNILEEGDVLDSEEFTEVVDPEEVLSRAEEKNGATDQNYNTQPNNHGNIHLTNGTTQSEFLLNTGQSHESPEEVMNMSLSTLSLQESVLLTSSISSFPTGDLKSLSSMQYCDSNVRSDTKMQSIPVGSSKSISNFSLEPTDIFTRSFELSSNNLGASKSTLSNFSLDLDEMSARITDSAL